MEITIREIAESVAPCGLVCALCRNDCKGCNKSKDSEISCMCFQRKCCRKKGLKGCWECPDFPCKSDMFDETKHDVRIKAFVRCIKEDGTQKFAEYILRNENNGVIYHRDNKNYTGDYDWLKNEEEVISLLRTGKKA